jgi:hypothetical protein
MYLGTQQSSCDAFHGVNTGAFVQYCTVGRKNLCLTSKVRSFLSFVYFFGGLECAGLSFVYIAHFRFFSGCLDLYPSAAVVSGRPTNLATHPLALATHHLTQNPFP